MIKIFKILDLVVSLVLVALGVTIYLLTKNWIAVATVAAVYVIWEVVVFRTYFKASKANQAAYREGYNDGIESTYEDDYDEEDEYDEEED